MTASIFRMTMNRSLLALAAVCGTAVLVLAACGSPRRAAGASRPVTQPIAATASPSPGSQVRPRLTMKQAKAVYIQIVHPGNTLSDLATQDWTDAAPWSKYRADTTALDAAVRQEERRLRAYRWPPQIQGYITAMILTDLPADLACDKVVTRASGYTAAQTVSALSQACAAVQNAVNASTIRARLGLPPPG
jgi:hypothetical protein